MFAYLEKIILSQYQWYRSGFLFLMFLVSFIMPGCSSTSSTQMYENSEFGISFEIPEDWSVEYDARTRSIVLKTEIGMWNKEMARISILGVSTSPLPYIPEHDLEAHVDRLRTLNNLEVSIVQEPTETENEDYEIAIATILISTMSLPKGSPLNQMGVQEPDTFQTVAMRTIKCTNNFALISVYKGNSEQLNAEAEDIVDSIVLTCSSEERP